MSNIDFNLEPVNKKPSRRYRKGSKYDPIIDQFLTSGMDLAQIEVEDIGANYLRAQLKKRIEARELENDVLVSVVNNISYLEREPIRPPIYPIRPPDK